MPSTSRSCPATTFAGTGLARSRLRRRTSAAGASTTTACAGTPWRSASARHAARRAGSRPVVSTTVRSRRAIRLATMRSSTSNASRLARTSRSPVPTTARSRSDETTWSGSNHRAAQSDLPAAVAPTSTTRHGSGRRSGGPSSTGAPYVTAAGAKRRAPARRQEAELPPPPPSPAGRGRPRAAAHDQLRRHREPRRRRVGAADGVEQEPQRAAPHLAEVLAHRRQRRREVLRLGDVVEAHHADRLGDPPVALVQRPQHPERHLVVGDEDRRDRRIVGEPLAEVVTGARAPGAGQHRRRLGARRLYRRAPAVDALL